MNPPNPSANPPGSNASSPGSPGVSLDRSDRPLLTSVRAALEPLTNTTLVVGVSGGPDSLCLLHLLTRVAPNAGVSLHIAHLDHALRAESPEDARFVQQVAKDWALPGTVERRTVSRPSEEAARRVRYRFFADVAKATGAPAVAVGHTADDQVETILLHLIRGSGLTGLAGMLSDTDRQGLRIIRPLLSIRRSETHAYCQRHDIPYRDDLSNLSPEFTRNRVRSELLSLLREFNPKVEEALLRLATTAQDEEDFWRWFLSQHTTPGLSRKTLTRLPKAAQTRLVIHAYRNLTGESLEATHVESVLKLLAGGHGKRASLPSSEAEIERDALVLRSKPAAKTPPWPPTALKIPGETVVGPWNVVCILRTAMPAPSAWSVVLDLDRTGPTLTLRPRHPGDRYRPTGMPAPKKLQDILVDAKVPRRLRETVPVLEGAPGVLWVGGHRVSEEFKVTKETKTALEMRLEPVSEAAHELARLYTWRAL